MDASYLFFLRTNDFRCVFRYYYGVNANTALVAIRACTLAKFHFHHTVFLRNTGLGTDVLFIKLELYCVANKKKINARLAFVYYPNENEMHQMVCNDIACICIPIVRIAFWYAHISF